MKHPYITTFATVLLTISVSGPAMAIDMDDLDVTIQVIDSDRAGARDIINRIELPRPRAEPRREGLPDGDAEEHDRGEHAGPTVQGPTRPGKARDMRPGRDDVRDERDDHTALGRDSASEAGKAIRDEAGQARSEVRESAAAHREQATQTFEERSSAVTQQIQDSMEDRESAKDRHDRERD